MADAIGIAPQGQAAPPAGIAAPPPVSDGLVDRVKKLEGFAPKAKWDYQQYSVGYGTKGQPGETIDKTTADARLRDELTKAATVVDKINPNLPPGVRDALTSLTFNAGPGWTQSGLGKAVQSGDLESAKQIFSQYNKAGGQTNPGLVNRRTAEAGWFDGKSAPSALALNDEQLSGGIANPLSGPVDKPVSAGISTPDAIPPAAQPAQYKSNGRGMNLGLISDNLRTPLIAAGLGMLASRSPNLGNAIGEGGLAGLKSYTEQKGVDFQARKLDQAAEMAQKKLDETTKYHQGILATKGQKNDTSDIFAPSAAPAIPPVQNVPNPPQSDDTTLPAKAKPAQFEPEKDVDPTKPLSSDQIDKQQNYYGDQLNTALKQAETSHAPGTHPEVLDTVKQKLGPGIASTIKAVSEGRQTLTSVPTRTYEVNGKKVSERAIVEQGVNLYNPNWEQGAAAQRAATIKDLAPNGKTGQLVLGVNQLLPHLKTASDAAAALDNGNFPAANAVTNWLRSNTGDPRVQKFNTVRDVAALDAARILRGAGAFSIEEVRNWQNNIKAANSPAQLQGVLHMLAGDLMGARMNSINYSYKMLVGKDAPDLLSPEAKSALKAIEGRATDTGPKQAAPSAAAVPQRPPTIPEGSQYSPSRKAWRTPDGQVIPAGP